jgi:hypothetical protein
MPIATIAAVMMGNSQMRCLNFMGLRLAERETWPMVAMSPGCGDAPPVTAGICPAVGAWSAIRNWVSGSLFHGKSAAARFSKDLTPRSAGAMQLTDLSGI